jgi:hydroxymethylglutaryl-CoA reductase
MRQFTHTLSSNDLEFLKSTIHDDLELANTLIENAVGYFRMPLALAPGITINEKLYPAIPLVTEETSVVAGLCKNIKLVNAQGTISASQEDNGFIGQIHFPNLQNVELFQKSIEHKKEYLIKLANQNPCASMVKRGGGVKNITIRIIALPDGKTMGIVHVLINTKDAMGANIINMTCEYLKVSIEELTSEKALFCILSNLNTEKLTTVEILLENIDKTLATNIEEASTIAQYDPYRAVTHNKGIMNGMDALCIATGNDWRALEAGIHGYAAHNQTYSGITKWASNGTQLKGVFKAPINVGIVGGVTSIHPMAAFSLKCLNATNSAELSYVMGAVGLIQNFAALRALVTDGISKGHMSLHLRNLLKQTDATEAEQKQALLGLKKLFSTQHYVTASDAHDVLIKIRS